MMMSRYLTLFIGAVYLGIAADHLVNGRGALALTFASYALANVGIAFIPLH